jgi:hypothetical protein
VIRNFIEAILVRAPIALVIFFVSIKQNSLFNSSQIITIGSILSSSVLYSILFLQPLGNIFNKIIGENHTEKITSVIDFRSLIIFLFLSVTIISTIIFSNTILFLAFNLATSQAIFQWCISYLTLKNKKSHLFALCFILILELLLVLYFFNFAKQTVYEWAVFLILSYYLPSILFFTINIKFRFALENLQNSLLLFLKLFISSASFYTVLAFFYWMLEFYPRISSSFGVYFTSNFNVYMSFSIGLVGAIDTVLNQMYLKKYLHLAATDKPKLILYFKKIITFNTFIYLLVLLFLFIFNQYYWKYIFDINRFADYTFFYFIFFIEVIRILSFHSFNIYFYIDRLDLIKNTLIIIIFSVFILFLLNHLFIFSGIDYLIYFALISLVSFSFNLLKLKNI